MGFRIWDCDMGFRIWDFRYGIVLWDFGYGIVSWDYGYGISNMGLCTRTLINPVLFENYSKKKIKKKVVSRIGSTNQQQHSKVTSNRVLTGARNDF